MFSTSLFSTFIMPHQPRSIRERVLVDEVSDHLQKPKSILGAPVYRQSARPSSNFHAALATPVLSSKEGKFYGAVQSPSQWHHLNMETTLCSRSFRTQRY